MRMPLHSDPHIKACHIFHPGFDFIHGLADRQPNSSRIDLHIYLLPCTEIELESSLNRLRVVFGHYTSSFGLAGEPHAFTSLPEGITEVALRNTRADRRLTGTGPKW